MAAVVGFVAWSDYLCPWCWNVSRRLQRLEEEFPGQIDIQWRSYLLRPRAKPGRDLERFRQYTESWRRPAAEPDAGPFQVWSSNEGPPTHSLPAHRVAKAAAAVSSDAFRRLHARLMSAYFVENKDISSEAVLRALWRDLALPDAAYAVAHAPETEAAIQADHEEARTLGATGVPAIRRIDNEAVIVGAHPIELYRRWIERSLERGDGLIERV